MRSSTAIGIGAAVAAVFTHGLVVSGVHFDDPLPLSTYREFFRNILLATERLWSFAHGWQPMSHIQDFGRFYAPAVQLICPLIGFTLFWILSRHKLGPHLWKPLAIASLLAVPTTYLDWAPAGVWPWLETARTVVVVSLMIAVARLLPAGPREALQA
jgi:hypothetical protein